MLCDDLEEWGGDGGREALEGSGICTQMSDSLHCTAETSTPL